MPAPRVDVGQQGPAGTASTMPAAFRRALTRGRYGQREVDQATRASQAQALAAGQARRQQTMQELLASGRQRIQAQQFSTSVQTQEAGNATALLSMLTGLRQSRIPATVPTEPAPTTAPPPTAPPPADPGGGGGPSEPTNGIPAAVNHFLWIGKKQIGDSYVTGTEGPSTFDCSGLVSFMLGKAGVDVGRQTAAGYQSTFSEWSVGRKQLQPGDLVYFWYPGNWQNRPPGVATHVEIYLGNGMTLGADNPDEPIRIESIDWDGFIGGTRVPQLYK